MLFPRLRSQYQLQCKCRLIQEVYGIRGNSSGELLGNDPGGVPSCDNGILVSLDWQLTQGFFQVSSYEVHRLSEKCHHSPAYCICLWTNSSSTREWYPECKVWQASGAKDSIPYISNNLGKSFPFPSVGFFICKWGPRSHLPLSSV